MNIGVFVEDVFPDLHRSLLSLADSSSSSSSSGLSAGSSWTEGMSALLAIPAHILETHRDYCPEVSHRVVAPFSIFYTHAGSGSSSGDTGHLLLRNPGLLVVEALGILVALVATTSLSRSMHRQRLASGRSRCDTLAYRSAVLAYLGMNLAAICAHNLFQKYTYEWKVAIDGDVCFTCCSCIYLSIAPLCASIKALRVFVERVNFFVLTIACVLLKTFVLSRFHLGFSNELMYLGGVAVATLASLAHFLAAHGSRPGGAALVLLVFAACGGIVAHGVWLEGEWCAATDGLVSSVPLVFAGCLLAMVVITVLHLLQVQADNKLMNLSSKKKI